MPGLPSRFPRASLIQHAAFLESRVNRLLLETNQLIEDSERSDVKPVYVRKLAQRYNALDEARMHLNDVRAALWELP